MSTVLELFVFLTKKFKLTNFLRFGSNYNRYSEISIAKNHWLLFWTCKAAKVRLIVWHLWLHSVSVSFLLYHLLIRSNSKTSYCGSFKPSFSLYIVVLRIWNHRYIMTVQQTKMTQNNYNYINVLFRVTIAMMCSAWGLQRREERGFWGR